MFVKAIKEVSLYTRPIHSVIRNYHGDLTPGAATFFFINENGIALTCKHVATMLAQSEAINSNFNKFKIELNALPKDKKHHENLKRLETKYKIRRDTVLQIKHSFINSVSPLQLRVIAHPILDLAILIFENFTQKQYSSYATFVKDDNKVQQGRYLCRLGFPFPEFNNYTLNQTTNDVEWTMTGNVLSPVFPIDGIITRFGTTSINNQPTKATIEMSTPGLRGQSGGPLFDADGLVYGMQSMTQHLHLGFDIKDKEILASNNKKERVSNYPFLHVGHCIHIDRIKEFLTANKITFYEA